MTLLFFVSVLVNGLIVWHYQIRVGTLVIENMQMVNKYFSKPWTKLFAVALGVSFAQFYMSLLRYRKGTRAEKEDQKFLHWLHKSCWLSPLVFLIGWAGFVFCLLIGHRDIADPYNWTVTQCAAYFALVRPLFSICMLMTMFPVFLGHMPIYKAVLSSQALRVSAKSVFLIALTHPIVIAFLYNTG